MITIEASNFKIISNVRIDTTETCVIAIGNFDGVHLAHQKLIQQVLDLKKRLGAKYSAVWCFDKNPLETLSNNPPAYIYSTDKKCDVLLSLGIDFVIVANFKFYQNIEPYDFARNQLKNQFNCIGMVCGYNSRFGAKAKGDALLLQEIFSPEKIVVVNAQKHNDIVISSTKIRNFILCGYIKEANMLLGRNFDLLAPVLKGKQLGHTIGFPTINQFFPIGGIVPKYGIYVSSCTLPDGKSFMGVTNIGVRPTIVTENDTHRQNCETYILNFNGDLYGQNVKVEFLDYVRTEKKFDSLEQLKSAIQNDVLYTKQYFENLKIQKN